MILGLTHVGLTVSDLERSLAYYRQTWGANLLSDAERRGPAVERVTGVPGFHARIAYLALAPFRHLELFEFFQPAHLPRLEENRPRAGLAQLLCRRDGPRPGEPGLLPSNQEAVDRFDPDGLLLHPVVAPQGRAEPLLPVLTVVDLDLAEKFYCQTLGLVLAAAGREEDPRLGRCQTALLGAATGPCLKLLHPQERPVAPPPPWRMERVGFTHLALGVRGLEALHPHLARRGVVFKSEPHRVMAGPHQGGLFVYGQTPEGWALEFVDSPLILAELDKGDLPHD